METAAPFGLSALRRDWIAGVSGPAFRRRVQRRIVALRAEDAADLRRGVLVAEADPVKFATAFFAAVHLRVPVVLANPRWGKREWDEVAAQLRPAFVFGSVPGLREPGKGGAKGLAASTILIPTGGSTAGVRFAVHRWESLVAAAEGLRSFLHAGPLHHCCVLPLFHVSGLMQVVRAFVTGGRISFADFSDLREGRFPKSTRGGRCLSLVATQLRRLMESKGALRELSKCRAVFLGGGPVPETVLDTARSLALPIYLSYGMTETAAMVAALPPQAFLAGETSAGLCLPHMQVDIVAEGGGVCPAGVPGRIRVRGRSLFEGYHGAAVPGLGRGYRTDDEGFLDSRGHLHVIGRCDRLIVSGGEKIDPQEVEAAILQTGAVDQVLVLGWPDAEWGQCLIAFYVGKKDSVATKMLEQLRMHLARYKVPKRMIAVERLPLNAHGKVDRDRVSILLRAQS